MLTIGVSGPPEIGSGRAGFSVNRTMRQSASFPVTPNARASPIDVSRQATVMSALLLRWASISRPQVITRQDENELGFALLQQVEVRVDGVRRPQVPMILQPPLRGQHVDELAETVVEETPAAFQMLDQTLRLVLRRHADPPDSRVDAV